MIGRLKRKHIENFLQNTPDFEALEKDKWNYEQHLTPPLIAAECLHRIYQVSLINNQNNEIYLFYLNKKDGRC